LATRLKELTVRTVDVRGEDRTCEQALAVRAVTSAAE
jgi:GMP synthase PP-ATPase subunit